jgi:hypothetical protein
MIMPQCALRAAMLRIRRSAAWVAVGVTRLATEDVLSSRSRTEPFPTSGSGGGFEGEDGGDEGGAALWAAAQAVE